MESSLFEERRFFPRYPFHSKALFASDRTQVEGMLIDLSLSGALFRGNMQVAAAQDEHCRLDILHGAGRSYARASGRVAYVRDDLVGLKFSVLDLGTVQGLMRIAEMNLDAPAMMKRELGVLLRAPGRRR